MIHIQFGIYFKCIIKVGNKWLMIRRQLLQLLFQLSLSKDKIFHGLHFPLILLQEILGGFWIILGFLHSSQPLQSQQTHVPNGLQISVAGQMGSFRDTHRQMGLDIGSLVVVITSVVVVSKSSSVGRSDFSC